MPKNVHAIAKQSTLTVSFTSGQLYVSMMPSSSGVFDKSSDTNVAISTDNYTGYSLFVASTGSTSLLNSHDDAVESISSEISESTFMSNSTYNNKWGYKPSQYITNSGGVDTVVQNSNYLPAPSLEGDLLAKTNAPNATNSNDTYTLAFGVRADNSLPTGQYSYEYNLIIIPNTIIYNVTYDANSTGTVSSMPSPNPQALQLDGGTATADSYVTLSRAVPTQADKSFGGWCDVVPTHNSLTDEDECGGNTYAAGADYPIDQTSSATNITLYAIWVNDDFPMVWTQMGACEFHGATNGNITGTECQDYTNDKFIDTGVALYSSANYQDDYQVHFTIDHYVPSENDDMADQQQTFVSDKLSPDATSSPYDGKSPGMIVRRSGDDIQIKNTSGHNNSDSANSGEISVSSSTTTDVSVYRISDKVYASINRGPLLNIQDVSTFDQQFGLNTWFGAYPSDDCTGNTTNGVCTNAMRYIEATLSNMYIKLGDFDESLLHEVTFNGNGGVPSTTKYTVIEGDTLGTLPTATRTDYVLMYWYRTSGGSSIATPETRVYSDSTYYAFWLKEVSQAQISNSSINLLIDGTETINVTNSAELEEYTFTSNDESIATVDSTTGLVTGIEEGTTTITMTGTKSHTTKTINVAVRDSMAMVTFDAGQGSTVNPIEVEYGGTISELPISIRNGYTLEGWYTGANGTGTKLTTSLTINNDTDFIANWIVTTNVCRLADPTALHEETCNRTSSGCRTNNIYANGEKITYGKVPQDSTLVAGIAYTCDINANNEYDEDTERFYYLGTNNSNAVLIWYKNISDVSINYNPAYTLLPDSSTWRNTNLIAQANNKVTRLMKASELTTACGGNSNGLRNKKCDYLMEKSNFANTNLIDGIWLEKINDTSSGGRRIHTTGLSLGNVNPADGGSNNAPRPVIEIPMNMLEVWSSSDYTITFDPHNETASWTETITPGDTLGNAYPASDPTYTNHIFQGWYTAETGGTLVTSNTEPNDSTTYHAQWKKTVALATFGSNSISVREGNTETIIVTNSSELEGYSFTSLDSTVATVNASTGVVTGVAEGTTYIQMTGATSGLTRTIEVNVLPPPQDFTVTFNANGGTLDDGASSTRTVTEGSAVGALPTASKANQKFFGWYSDDGTFYEEVYANEVIEGNITFYAKWVDDTINMPIVWSEINACTFDGVNNVSGDYCSTSNKTDKFINTAIQLFTQANYEKDFEVGFTIVEFNLSASGSQATFLNSKLENSANNYPGFVFRRYNSTDYVEVTARWKGNSGASNSILASDVNSVKVVRKIEDVNGTDHIILYYSINGGTLTPLQDITDVTTVYFDTNTWFGASADANNEMQRPLVGTLTDMYIRLGSSATPNAEPNPNVGALSNNAQIEHITTASDPIEATISSTESQQQQSPSPEISANSINDNTLQTQSMDNNIYNTEDNVEVNVEKNEDNIYNSSDYYNDPLGVYESDPKTTSSSSSSVGLAAMAAVITTSGAITLVYAKRNEK